jgi:hypothetical protein
MLFVGWLISYLRYLCLLALRTMVPSTNLLILCSVFVLLVFVLCLVCLMFPVFVCFPILMTASVFSNIYLYVKIKQDTYFLQFYFYFYAMVLIQKCAAFW